MVDGYISKVIIAPCPSTTLSQIIHIISLHNNITFSTVSIEYQNL